MISNFLFHRVSPLRDELWDPMDVKLFEKCIQYIKKNFEVVLIEDIFNKKEIFQTKRYATIMFDDGYKDNIIYAADILKKYNCLASFYVITNCIEKNLIPWMHSLEYIFQYTKQKNIVIDCSFLPKHLHIKELATKEKRIMYFKNLRPILKSLKFKHQQLVINQILYYFNDVEQPALMMNWQDLNQLKNEGHYIGSHTVNHYMLGTIDDEKIIENEFKQSALDIEKNLGYVPCSVSYPVGSYNQQVINICKNSGYKIGLAVNQKIFNPNTDDLFEIHRIGLYNESWLKTKLRITNTIEKIKKIIRYS